MESPVITSRIHGCMEAVSENVSGFLIEKENTDDLYEKIIKFISLNFQTKKEMGMEERKIIEENFDKKKVVKLTLEKLLIIK